MSDSCPQPISPPGKWPDRYTRQMLFTPVGEEGQRRLSSAHVLLVGCGALGSVIANLLTRAGVGHLRIVDRDVLDATNLHRQVLFDEADLAADLPKAEAARRKLVAINSDVHIEAVVADANPENIRELAEGADLLLDGTDNFETRYLLNDLAVLYDDWGREEEAEDHYRQALAADPTHGPAYVNLGTLLAERGRDEEATSILQQGMEQAADEEDRHEAELYLQELMAGDDEALEEDEDWVEDADWVEIAVVGGITLAEVIATSLRAAGIPALAYQEGAGQALGLTIGALGDASVLVPESRVDEARRLVDERMFAGLDNMGEEGEDDYLVCPHCGATLELTEEEWAQDSVVCPACDEVIDLTAYE